MQLRCISEFRSKAKLCVSGKEALYQYCLSRNVAHQKIEINVGALVDGLYKHLKPEDFEKRGERFKDVTPPDLPEAAISRLPKSEDAMAKPAGKKEETAKVLN